MTTFIDNSWNPLVHPKYALIWELLGSICKIESRFEKYWKITNSEDVFIFLGAYKMVKVNPRYIGVHGQILKTIPKFEIYYVPQLKIRFYKSLEPIPFKTTYAFIEFIELL